MRKLLRKKRHCCVFYPLRRVSGRELGRSGSIIADVCPIHSLGVRERRRTHVTRTRSVRHRLLLLLLLLLTTLVAITTVAKRVQPIRRAGSQSSREHRHGSRRLTLNHRQHTHTHINKQQLQFKLAIFSFTLLSRKTKSIMRLVTDRVRLCVNKFTPKLQTERDRLTFPSQPTVGQINLDRAPRGN